MNWGLVPPGLLQLNCAPRLAHVLAGSIFRSSECYSETRDRGTERQGLVYSAQWRNPYNLGTNLGYQSAVNYQLIVIKETKGYVCDETRQSIDGSPELFRVVDQQRYEKASK